MKESKHFENFRLSIVIEESLGSGLRECGCGAQVGDG
jgi:hypothetical protein